MPPRMCAVLYATTLCEVAAHLVVLLVLYTGALLVESMAVDEASQPIHRRRKTNRDKTQQSRCMAFCVTPAEPSKKTCCMC